MLHLMALAEEMVKQINNQKENKVPSWVSWAGVASPPPHVLFFVHFCT